MLRSRRALRTLRLCGRFGDEILSAARERMEWADEEGLHRSRRHD